jgi:hypothetical protein
MPAAAEPEKLVNISRTRNHFQELTCSDPSGTEAKNTKQWPSNESRNCDDSDSGNYGSCTACIVESRHFLGLKLSVSGSRRSICNSLEGQEAEYFRKK